MLVSEKVYRLTSKIPKGKVVTYKQIAEKADIKNPRLVGFILHKNKDPKNIPCHRVVRSDGILASNYAFGEKKEQRRKLEEEGIKFEKDKINLKDSSFPL